MALLPYVFKRTHQFRKAFDSLNPTEQQAAKEAFKKFRLDPFNPSLKPHKINRLSALQRTTVWSVTIARDLKAVFLIDGNSVISLDIGNHDIYK